MFEIPTEIPFLAATRSPRNRSAAASVAVILLLAAVSLLLLALGATAPEARAVSSSEPIQGYAPVTAAQLEAALSLHNPGHIHPDIAQYYAIWGPRFGIRADVAFAQMMHETGNLRYGGVVQPWQNNFAGIGAFDSQHPGYSWPSAEAGVIGHYAHLAWFIFPNHVNQYCNTTWDPGHGSYHRNSARTMFDLGGQWAVPGVGYGDRLARYASEFYFFTPGGHWRGNFNEVPGTPQTELSTRFHFPWYDSMPSHGMGGNWLIIGNRGSGAAVVRIWIGATLMDNPEQPGTFQFTIPEGGQITPMFANTMGGPVTVLSESGQPLIASQRVLYRETFSEVPGVPAARLADSYEFTWYDARAGAYMYGNWILVSNLGSQPADVEVWIGESKVAEYKASLGSSVAPGASVTPMFPELMGGPVRVLSTNGQQLIASQRVLYQESFSEVMGYPTRDLASQYFFSWYDSDLTHGMKGDWLVIANRGGSPADVDVLVGGSVMASYKTESGNAIAPGAAVAPSFSNVTDGPVEIVSTNGQPLLASQRVLFRDSFEEVNGVTQAALAGTQFFTWYDTYPSHDMGGDWIMVTNLGAGEATVRIWIGSTLVDNPDHPGTFLFTVPEDGRITPSFTNTMGGPVTVFSESGQPLLTSQRVLYKYNVAYCGSVPCG